jgi:acetyl-CoA acetyltransferase
MYTLNLGIDAVKKMYKDNGIANYRYKDYDFIENNELSKTARAGNLGILQSVVV